MRSEHRFTRSLVALSLVSFSLCYGCGDKTIVEPEEVRIIVTTSIEQGTKVVIDGDTLTAPAARMWEEGSVHEIGVPEIQTFGAGKRYVFEEWSDGRARTHQITVSKSTEVYTASLLTEYRLTVVVDPPEGASVDLEPAGPWYPAGSEIALTATGSFRYIFGGLTHSVDPATDLGYALT